jgi:hypothetical protein
MSVNANHVMKIHKLIEEVNEVVGIWEIWISECPVNPIKVKVLHLHPQEMYMGITNYSIQNPKQATPYKSLHMFRTVQEALEDAIRGFLMFYDPKLKDQTKFILDENF